MPKSAYDLSYSFENKLKINGSFMLQAAEYLIKTADRCIGIANNGRRLADELSTVGGQDQNKCESIAAAGRELVNELEAIGQEMLAKAVEIDALRQKSNPGTFGP